MYLENSGLHSRIQQSIPNGGGYFDRVREYWNDPKYVIILPTLRQISYEPLEGAAQDLDIAMYWLCREAAPDVEYNLELLHSAKLWLTVKVRYESANPEEPNAKQFDQELSVRPTIIGEIPITELNINDPYKSYRDALRLLADRILQFHARFIREKSGFVLTQIYHCQLFVLKFNPIGSGYVPLPKFLSSKKALLNVRNFDNRCFGYAILSAF